MFLIEGHKDREEERIWPIRRLYALLHNVNVDGKRSKAKSEIDLWPFESERKLIKLRERLNTEKEMREYFSPDRDKVKFKKR